MGRTRLHNTMIGKVYPFFLNNTNLQSYYLYQVNTPGISSNEVPLLSLTKLSEKTMNKGEYSMKEGDTRQYDLDVIFTIIHSRTNSFKKISDFMYRNILDRAEGVYGKADLYYDLNEFKFPMWEVEKNNNVTRAIIVGVRDQLRWSKYRFQEGCYIDVLVTPTKFAVFKLVGDGKDQLWLEPVGVYNNYDVDMKNNLTDSLGKLNYPKVKWSGEKRASDINRVIRSMEQKSFDAAEI